jgi:hypothetical protein
MIEKIQRVKLRTVWPHEALDFTKWLEDNFDVLNEALGVNLVSVEREQSAGTFSVDLVGEDGAGRTVIIENQLEKSDHDHLGKVITYLTSLEAKSAIWIVAEPRPEHIKAISWLNESSAASFYLVKLEAIKIGDSPPAPLLTLITGPSAEAIKAGEKKKELSVRDLERTKFWTGLLDKAKQKSRLHANLSPTIYNWTGTSAGLPSGLWFNYSIRKHDGQVELYIDSDQDDGERNTSIFNKFMQKKNDIEEAFGEPLEWQALESRRACRIRLVIEGGGWRDENCWSEVQDRMVDAMTRLEKAFAPHFKNL